MASSNRPTRIPVYRSHQSKVPYRWVKPDFAIECLLADRIEFRQDRLGIVWKSIPIVASDHNVEVRSEIYEKAAITKNRRQFNGGLTRHEHQPAAFHRFKGARVGHGP